MLGGKEVSVSTKTESIQSIIARMYNRFLVANVIYLSNETMTSRHSEQWTKFPGWTKTMDKNEI